MNAGRLAPLLVGAALLLLPAAPVGAADAPSALPVLAEGRTVRVRLERGSPPWSARIVPPAGAERIHVWTDSAQDVDLYLARAALGPEDLADAPWSRRTAGGAEHLLVSRVGARDLEKPWVLTVDHPARARGGATILVAWAAEGPGRARVLAGDGAQDAWTAAGEARLWVAAGTRAVRLTGLKGRLSGTSPSGTAWVGAPPEDGPRARLALPTPEPGLWSIAWDAGDAWKPGTRGPVLDRETAVRDDAPPRLLPGVETEAKIPRKAEPPRWRFDVPPGVPACEITAVAGSGADFDLYLRHGEPAAGSLAEDDLFAVANGPEERLLLGGTRGVRPGAWHLTVVPADEEKDAEVTLLLRPLVGIAARAAPCRGRLPALAPNRWTPGTLRPERSAVAWHAVAVPEGATELWLQIAEASSDLEWLVLDPEWGTVAARALSGQLDERLVVDLRETGLALERNLVVGVRMPPFDRPEDSPLEQGLRSVVEVSTGETGGSGVCLHPDGWILTCRHVLEEPEEEGEAVPGKTGTLTTGPIWVSFMDDWTLPPRQTHRAQIVGEDAALDIALLKITEDVYGRPLPETPRFSFRPLAEGIPRLGATVWAAGYPAEATEHSRTPVVATRGIVVGLEAETGGLAWIKTDARIASGHSGGALFDDRGGVLGVNTATLGRYEQFGLVRPASRLPAEWQRRFPLPPPEGRK